MYFYKHHFFYTFIRTCDKTIHINIYIFWSGIYQKLVFLFSKQIFFKAFLAAACNFFITFGKITSTQ